MKYYRNIEDQQRAIYLYIKGKGYAVSLGMIARYLRCSVRTVQRRIKELQEQGEVNRFTTRIGKSAYGWLYFIPAKKYEDEIPF